MNDTDQTGQRHQVPATAARIYDYLLGGTHNFPADRTAAQQLVEQFPVIPQAVQANRATLRRMVTHLAHTGIDQFLDIGSGMPTQSPVHDIAQHINPHARVVYVDIDPVAVIESLDILNHNPNATAICGDLRTPHTILDHPRIRDTLDFTKPIAVLLMGILHFIPDDPLAHMVITNLLDAIPTGSYLAISHLATETMDITQTRHDSYDIVEGIYRQHTATPLGARTKERVRSLFATCTMIEPGLVWMTQWRPTADDPHDFTDDPRRCGWWAGLGTIDR